MRMRYAPSYTGIIVTVTDAKSGTDMVTVTVNVTDVDEAPTVTVTERYGTVYNHTENAATNTLVVHLLQDRPGRGSRRTGYCPDRTLTSLKLAMVTVTVC